jgi:hypothetical protein
MINRILEALFPKLGEARKLRHALSVLNDIVENEKATAEMQTAARDANASYVLLTPTIPLNRESNAGWFGGAPRLPNDVPWPEEDGRPLVFACQINLAALPKSLWSGLGPRNGWLAIFISQTSYATKALHIDGPVETRAPPPNINIGWILGRAFAGHDGEPPQLRHWPIAVSEHVGPPPAPERKRRHRLTPDFFDPLPDEFKDLSDPSSHPFNGATLRLLLESIASDLGRSERWLDGLLDKNKGKKLREPDREKLTQAKEALRQSQERFARIRSELEPFVENFDLASIAPLLEEIGHIPTFDVDYLRNDEEGFVVVELPPRTVNELAPPNKPDCWWRPYLEDLYRHGLSAYVADPSALHPALRERMESFWRLDAITERGAMGHAPEGHIYTPNGPKSPNEILLELPSSWLVGWLWGGFYSIVLIIKRDALERGDFSKIMFDISN